MSRPAPSLLVLGGSVAGLATALFAARRGVAVTVLERDDGAAPRPFEEPVARDPRMVTPQASHSHAFLATAVRVLDHEAPDVLDALTRNKAPRLRLRPPEGLDPQPTDDADLEVLLARRTTFEAVLRSVVAEQDGVTMRPGVGATGLRLDHGGPVPHVVGVETGDGPVEADLVVDATGCNGRVHRWLRDAGVVLDERDTDCGIAYHSRFYRLHTGAGWGPLNRGYTAGSSFDRYSCLVFPGDGASFSVTFGTLPEDTTLAGLRDDAGFDAAAGAVDLVRAWVDPARAAPISGVRTMTRMRNRIRRLVVDGAPTVAGLALAADAAAISNPAHSRGCALALTHAAALAGLVADAPEPVEFALRADQSVGRLLAPWVDDSARQDAARLSRWRVDGGEVPDPVPLDPDAGDRVTNGEAWVASHHDPVVWRAFTRLQQLLATPDEVLGDPEVVRRVRATQEAGLGLPPVRGPSHDELVALLDDAAPVEAEPTVRAG